MLRHVVILLAVVGVALSAVARLKLEPKPEEYKDCDGCWVSEIQQFIPLDESVPSPTACEEYKCTATEVLILSCGTVGVKSPCYVTRDLSKPYPGCCDQIVCPPKV